jgi:hypothetical protein
MKHIFIPLFIILIFSGCSLRLFDKNSEPKWLKDPQYSVGDKRAAVGCSAIHAQGKNAQEKLAIQRAIESIALQKQSTVSNVTLRSKSVSSGNLSNSTMNSNSLHQVNSVNISTKVLDRYTNKDGDICVWVVEE